ncbi:MAG: divalent-cation tolerance protein CutA [Alphaproteobacteria bacterium]|nr:divalent-cation tolerance protein CutA [Alphaproteobacteria bacterium]
MLLTYVPFPTFNDAKYIAEEILKRKYASCVNILPSVYSFYLWPNEDGIEKVCEANETIAFFKHTDTQTQHIRSYLEKVHPYDCPAIISIECKANKGFEAYLTSHQASP